MCRLGLVSKFWRLVLVSCRLLKPTYRSRLGLGRWAPRSRAFTSRAHPCRVMVISSMHSISHTPHCPHQLAHSCDSLTGAGQWREMQLCICDRLYDVTRLVQLHLAQFRPWMAAYCRGVNKACSSMWREETVKCDQPPVMTWHSPPPIHCLYLWQLHQLYMSAFKLNTCQEKSLATWKCQQFYWSTSRTVLYIGLDGS